MESQLRSTLVLILVLCALLASGCGGGSQSNPPPLPTPIAATTPVFSPSPGTYNPFTVTIMDSTAGASIYYTTDGTAPTTASTRYASPIAISASASVKAIAAAPGFTQSAVATASYTVVPVATQRYAWNSVKIIDGGDMPSIVMHPSMPGLMYIRANIGGAYRWDSSTQLWVPVTDWITGADWSLSGVESIAVDPSDSNRVYLVAGMYLQWSPINAAILISTDRGSTFQRVNLPFMMGGNDTGQQTGERLVVNPFNSRQLYLATHLNGLWQSVDYGLTWSQVANFPITSSTDKVGLSFVRFDPRHSGTVFVGAYTGGIYRSADGGGNWQSIPGQPAVLANGDAARPMRSALGPDGILYVTYANNSTLEGISSGAIYKLNPGNGIWTNITPADPQGISKYGLVGLAADPQQPNTVMAATWNRSWVPGDTIFRSTDGGANWTSLADYSARDGSLSPFVDAPGGASIFGNWISSVEIDPFDSNHALYTTGSTVWRTSDLTNADAKHTIHWTIGADGIEETAVLTLASPPAGAHLLSGVGDVCGYRHDDFTVSGPPFVNPWMQTVSSLDFAESNPLLMVRAGLLDYNGTAAGAYSRDQGTTWTQFPRNAAGTAGNPPNLYSTTIAISADGTTLVWAPMAASPSYSRDLGTTWTPSTGGASNLYIAADRVNSNKFYGFDGSTGTFYVSNDGGATFAIRATALPHDAGSPITNQAHPRAVPGREGDIWLPLASGLYHSIDSGASFTQIGTIQGAPLVGFGKAAPGQAYPAVYVVGTIGSLYGIFRSDDAGATWTRINDDNHQYGMLSVIAGDPRTYGRAYLGTSGRGVLYADIAP